MNENENMKGEQELNTTTFEGKDYSKMSDDELKTQYSSIMTQINSIQKKIDDICEKDEASTIYAYDDSGEIVLVSNENLSKDEALYEMEQIVSDLNERLNEIEDYYTGTELRETPILEKMDEDFYTDDFSNVESLKGRKL